MKTNCKNILKAVLFSFVVNLLLAAVVISDARRMFLSGLTPLFLMLGILIVYCTLFSVIKGDTVNFWLYNIVSVLSHIVFTVLTFLIVDYFYIGQDTFLFYMTEILSLFACFASVIIDSIVCLVNKKTGK